MSHTGFKLTMQHLKITVLYAHALPTEPHRQSIGNFSLLRFIYIYCDIKYLVHFRICTYDGGRTYI